MSIKCVSKKCSNCNRTISEEMKFCGNCGAKLKFADGEIFNHILNLEKLHNIKIAWIDYVTALPNNTKVGIITLSNGRNALFYGNEIINKIGGKVIDFVLRLYFRQDGLLAGVLSFSHDSNYMLFIGDKIFNEIAGMKIKYVKYVWLRPNGELAGAFYPDIEPNFSDGSIHVFINNKIVEKLGNKEIKYISDVFVLPNGFITGVAEIDSKWHLFIGDQIIDFEHTEELKEGYPLDAMILPNGELIGCYCTGFASRCVPFKGNKVLEEIDGEKIISCDIDALPDNTLSGRVVFSKYRAAGLLWHGTKIKVTELKSD